MLDVSGPAMGEVACAADGKLTAIYVGSAQPGGSDLVVASSRR